MWKQNRVTKRLNIRYPVIQAGMAGGATPPELVAAVSEAGGLGTLGAGYLSPEGIRGAVREIRSRTSKPFAVNLLVTEAVKPSPKEVRRSQELLDPYREELGLKRQEPANFAESFEEQIQVLMEERVPVFSFTFDIPEERWLKRFREMGTTLIGTATTVREAQLLEKAGVDLVVAQGAEAGGHRGTFAGPSDRAMVGTLALVPQVADQVKVPVIAAGGVMDGRGLAAALALGAEGVQLGTAFLTCEESGAHPVHQEKILSGTEESTVVTRAFSGKPARGIRNRLIQDLSSRERTLPPYPVQNALTRDIRKAAALNRDPELMSLWAGQGLRLSRRGTAEDLIRKVVGEAEEVLRRLTRDTSRYF
ncbi:nitronate monooxygenase [Melghirimyces profundicolus]|uniref:Probable nitronate monooxygenase n=1 Tax=Melghirimyces profundicolus TaxID=1242148 RepID=A0A2T6B0S1_9BACL|nr:nitronate monooxygenase family protein [Melghirimyces profundicolus]PTX49622.1 nitronate monooxygenase [Melghirimyces profundicolus]